METSSAPAGAPVGRWKTWFVRYRNAVLTTAIAIGLGVAAFAVVNYLDLLHPDVPHVRYEPVYSLVPPEISESAAIVVTLPDDVTREAAKLNLAFVPEIDGSWSDGPSERQLTFTPKKKLRKGRHYAVTLTLPSGTIGKDFLVVEDPAVAAVFPAGGSEANENSKITVVFNRPMIPLTTLTETDQKHIPVAVIPHTEGEYKWIGTRTVQFTPKERLQRASTYTVSVVADTRSEDGVAIPGYTVQFDTRHLRYAHMWGGVTTYDQPMRLQFNQPVDLARTAAEITVQDKTKVTVVETIIEYGTTEVYNQDKKRYEQQTDESVLLVYQKKDTHGRDKRWDFTHHYELKINKAYPKEGNLVLNESRTLTMEVTNVVESFSARSHRSTAVASDVFDPEGTLAIRFYEDIDINRSRFTSSKKISLSYGEKCKELEKGEETVIDTSDTATCPKVSDHRTVIVAFEKGSLAQGERVPVTLEAVVNAARFTINPTPITHTITVAPALRLLKSQPGNLTTNADVERMLLCTNTPLQPVEKERIGTALTLSRDYTFGIWRPSDRIPLNTKPVDTWCQPGAFVTTLEYQLLPQTDYTAGLHLTDHFGSEINTGLSFRSGDIPAKNLNFYHYQKDYVVTTPDKTVFTYAGENMTFVDLHVCELTPEAFVKRLNQRPSYIEGPGAVPECVRTANKRVELPKLFWVRNYFTIDLKEYIKEPLGHYIITFSNPAYKEWNEPYRQIFERNYVTVTNVSVVEKHVDVHTPTEDDNRSDATLPDAVKKDLSSLYWVTGMKTLAPIVGAKVDVFPAGKNYGTYGTPVTVSTNERGIASVTSVPNRALVIVRQGKDSAILMSRSQLGWNDWARTADRLYLYTDRPIYRPGHEVFIKGLYRVGYDGSYDIFRDKKVHVRVVDSGDNEVYAADLDVSDYGTLNASFTLPMAASTGGYRIETDGRGWAYFDVEEYVGAPFKVETKVGKDEYMAGETFHVSVDANYYFGVPVEGGTVEYSVASQDYYFDKYRGDEYFQFGRGWYGCYDECSYGDRFLFRGTAELSANGKADISRSLDWKTLFPKEADRGSKILVVYMRVKNSTGASISAQQSFIVHGGEYYLGVNSDGYFTAKNQPVTLRMKSVNTEGEEVSVSGVSVTWNKVTWTQYKRREVDGSYYYRSERKLEQVATMTANTDRKGNWSGTYTPTAGGEYQVDVRGTDRKGNVIFTRYIFYVYGDGQADVRQSNDTTLELIADDTDMNVGDTASFIIASPYPEAKALIAIERGRIYSYEIVDIKQNYYKYSFPITDAYIPNVSVSVVLLSPKPEVKYGQVFYRINTTQKELNVSVTTNKKEYLPGEEVVLHFDAKDSGGKPVEAEFSAAVVDMSVLALKGNPKKNPVMFFYDGFPLAVSTESNLKDVLYTMEVPNNTKGGGGGSPDDLAKKKRGVFKDTAFWSAAVVTDVSGKATMRFTLPDNLTTWQVEGVAITKDTKLGVSYSEMMSRKALMVTPLEPRFVIPGDVFMVGAKVFNETGDTRSFAVSFKSPSLTLVDDKDSKKVSVKNHESKTVYFAVRAASNMRSGVHGYTVSAVHDDFEDTVERSIRIQPNVTYETVATAAASTDERVTESLFVPNNVEPDRGELTVHTSASLSVFFSDALKYLLEFPYGSSEQLASKLDAIALMKTSLSQLDMEEKMEDNVKFNDRTYTIDEAVQLGLARLYLRQHTDGGFLYYENGYDSWYRQQESNRYLSMHVGRALSALKKAGYPVDEARYERLVQYLTSIPNTKSWWYPGDNDFKIMLVSTLSEMEGPGRLNKRFVADINGVLKDNGYLKERISNSSLATLAILLSAEQKTFGKSAGNKVFDLLETRLDIDARGTYLTTNSNLQWQCYETPIRNTALYLNAIARSKRDTVIADRVLRWLLSSRSKDGAWGSTPNTLAVIEAMSNYAAMQGEQVSSFTLATLIDGVEKTKTTYATSTLWSQSELVVPMSDLPKGRITTVGFAKENLNKQRNGFYYDAALKYYLPIETIAPRDEGFTISRNLYRLDDTDFKTPLVTGKVGDLMRVRGEIIVPRSRNFVTIEDFIPAGAEIVNFNLATEANTVFGEEQPRQEYDWWYYEPRTSFPLRTSIEEVRDDRVYMAAERIDPGTYTYEYIIRLLVPGTYYHLPAVIAEDYFPENFGRTAGSIFTVTQ